MKKFTLIELLVVVAIIGILASILLPSLSQARLKAQSAICKANLKNMYPAVLMYSDDSESYLPVSQRIYGNVEPHVWWRRQAIIYMSDLGEPGTTNASKFPIELSEGVFKCPNVANQITDFKGGGYGWNLNYLGWGMGNPPNQHKPQRLVDVELPGETVSIGDGSDDESLQTWEKIMLLRPSLNKVSSRHQQGLNLQWLDGHATSNKLSSVLAGKGGDQDYFYKLSK
jgi:prepilin-type N-terminal cleavage/methylation domain-containing protein/prepilin-type processing-associated H-X9-DG protein